MRNNLIVSKMLEYIEKILKYTLNMDYDSFVKQEMVLEACVFNLSQIGELANKLDDTYQEEHNSIPWRQIYGLRNRIVHDCKIPQVWERIDFI